MRSVKGNDIYEIRLATRVSDLEKKSLLDLYFPIIGSDAVAVYSWLLNKGENEIGLDSGVKIHSHQEIFEETSLTTGEFQVSLSRLEAIGLARSFYRKDEDSSYFVYVIYPPKNDYFFFEDVLLSETLKKYVGEKKFNEKKNLVYYRDRTKIEGFEEVSEKFENVYNLDKSNLVGLNKNKKVKTNYLSYDKNALLEEIKKTTVKPNSLSVEEVEEAIKYGALYQIDYDRMAEIIERNYSSLREEGKRIDFDKVEEECLQSETFQYQKRGNRKINASTSSALGKKIALLSEYSPAKYLSLLMGGGEITPSHKRLIENLSSKIKIPNPVINAIIDFVVESNNGMISASYCESLATACKIQGIDNAIDAMEFLKEERKRKKNRSYNPSYKEKDKKEEEKQEEEVSWDEIEKGLKDIGLE